VSSTDASHRAGPDRGDEPAAFPPERPAAEKGAGEGRALAMIEAYALPALFIATLVFFTVWPKTSKTFPTAANITNVLGSTSVVGILAVAIIIPLVCSQFDFSVGAIAGFSQVICAGLMSKMGLPLPVAVLAAIAIGAFVGLSNGNTVARVGVNSLIVTLGVSQVLLGLVQWYTGGQSIITDISPDLIKIGGNVVTIGGDAAEGVAGFGIPGTVVFLAVVALFVWYLLEHTPYGRYLHSIGSNREAARLVGLRVERNVLLSFVLSGTLAGLAGVLLVARNGSANPQVGTVVDTLQALSAAYLGATAFKPGRFNVPGTLVAIFFLAFTVTGLSLAGVENWISSVFNGAALFVAVLISTIVGRKRAGVA
jgi:ribose transport system permease protein